MNTALLTAALLAAAGARAGAAEHRAQVVVGRDERLYFHDRPTPCPAQGACAWRRPAYLVAGDRVLEHESTNGFSRITHVRYEQVAPGAYEEAGRTTGWVRSDGLCLFPPMRSTRVEPMPVVKAPGRKACPMQGVTRTVDDDAAFYNGTFRSDTATLVVTDAGGGELSFTLKVARDECRLEMSGRAEARRESLFGFAGDAPEGCRFTVAFTDHGAELDLFECGPPACEGAKERLAWREIP
jgi:hypothetical protein